MLNYDDRNMKRSVSQIIDALEKITNCPTTTQQNFATQLTNNRMGKLDALKDEAKKLLEEVNCFDGKFSDTATRCNSSYIYEKLFEEYSFKERIEQLKQKIQLLEISAA